MSSKLPASFVSLASRCGFVASPSSEMTLLHQDQAGPPAEEGMEDGVPQQAAARTDEASAESCTLYIKNLAFATAEEGLQVRPASPAFGPDLSREDDANKYGMTPVEIMSTRQKALVLTWQILAGPAGGSAYMYRCHPNFCLS